MKRTFGHGSFRIGGGLAAFGIAVCLLAGAGLAAAGEPVAGPHGFPLPSDAVEAGEVPGGSGKVRVYDVPRGKDVVAAEERKLLKAAGWKITRDEVSPKGTIRMTTEKEGVVIAASVAGTAEKSSIVLTLP